MPATPPVSPVTLTARTTGIIVVVLLVLFVVLLVGSVRQESQMFDESAHIFAGTQYWKHGDFGRNPEHPPLAKLLAAIPVLSMDIKEPQPIPIPFFKAQDIVNGSQFLYSGDADAILLRGRLVIALISIALAVLVFFAAQEMFNPLAGVLALGIFSFEPILLANGALITTDMPVTLAFFAAVYTFYRYIKRPSLLRFALCAVATALCIITKHSGVVIFPTLVLLGLAETFLVSPQASSDDPTKSQRRGRLLGQLAVALIAIVFVSYVLLWAIYGFRYAARPGDLKIEPTLSAYSAGLTHPLQRSVVDFLARHRLLPEAYLFGWVDILLIPGNRPSFLLGRVLSSGVWYYFPVAFLLKTSLTLIILLLLVPFARIRGYRREFLFLTLPIVFYALVAIFSMLNIGIRHLLPIYPFCIVLAGAAAASFATRSIVSKAFVAALLLLLVGSSLHAFPDYLAYSNELIGGPSHNYLGFADANSDWGQGLKWTKTYLDQHPAPDCWFDDYGPFLSPAYYGIKCKPLITGFGHLFGMASAVPRTLTGTILLSSTDLDGMLWGPDELNPYRTFRDRKPDALIGNIILVYHGTFDVPLLAAHANAAAATSLIPQRRFSEAVALAQTAVQQAPDSAEVNAALGQCLLASGRTVEGKQSIVTAIHLAQTVHPEYQKQLIARLHFLNLSP
jgi:Dolichyl-phosphate-mannose-protein mannosyltransferase/Tetratricopeptide repeat